MVAARVGDVPGGGGGDVDGAEFGRGPRDRAQHLDPGLGDVGGVQGGGAIDDDPVDRRLPVVPAARPLGVDVGRPVGEELERGT